MLKDNLITKSFQKECGMRNLLPQNWIKSIQNNREALRQEQDEAWGASSLGDYIDNAKSTMEVNYGVPSSAVDAIIHDSADQYVQAYNEGTSTDELANVKASMLSLTKATGLNSDMNKYYAGKNKARIALIEFTSEESDRSVGWNYVSGYLTQSTDGNTLVIEPSFNIHNDGWEFRACEVSVPLNKFMKLPEASKERLVKDALGSTGDIDQCINYALNNDPSLTAPKSAIGM